MKVRLLLATICIFILPMWFSLAPNKAAMNPAPVAMVALAGHVGPNGAWCACGSFDDCICDEGETRVRTKPAPNEPPRDDTAETSAGFDPGASVLLITLVLLLGLRMRL